jgi:hypothetical protein
MRYTILAIALSILTSGSFAQSALGLRLSFPSVDDTIRTDSMRIEGAALPGTEIDAKGVVIRVQEDGRFRFNMQSPRQPGAFTLKLAARRGEVLDSLLVPFVRIVLASTSYSGLRIAMHGESTHKAWMEKLKAALVIQDPTLQWVEGSNCRDVACAMAQSRAQRIDLALIVNGQELKREVLLAAGYSGLQFTADSLEDSSSQETLQRWAGQCLAAYRDAYAASGEQKQYRDNELLAGKTLGTDYVDGILTAAQGPYLIYGALTIPAGKTLRLEPGTIVLFHPGMRSSLDVQGKLVAAGTAERPVRFRSAARSEMPGDWDRLLIRGAETSELRETEISGSQWGVHVEQGHLQMQNGVIQGNGERGVFARDAEVRITDCRIIGNRGAGIHASAFSSVALERSVVEKNQVGIALTGSAQLEMLSSVVRENGTGVVQLQEARLSFLNSKLQRNPIGWVSEDLPSKEIADSILGSTYNLRRAAPNYVASLPEPDFAGIRKPYSPGRRRSPVALMDTIAPLWQWNGNINGTAYYHGVKTARVEKGEPWISGVDTLWPGEKYPNGFVTPGLGLTTNLYLLGVGPGQQSLEFLAELSYDDWDRQRADPFTLSYTNSRYAVTLGDFQASRGELYLSGMDLLGVQGELYLGRNTLGDPLFALRAAGGEMKSPLGKGDRNPGVYGDTLGEGEATAQRLAGLASVHFAPVRRFEMEVGVLAADDRMVDPLLRDGHAATETSDPMRTALAVFADGDWLFWPGDIDLNGQIAVGRADTANVELERAINQVFTDAGIAVSSLSQLRRSMNDPHWIDQASTAELQAIFGTGALSATQMRDSLKVLRTQALNVRDSAQVATEDGRALGLNWGSQDFALRGEAHWQFWKTTLSGKLRYVGSHYVSPGSEGLAQNSREIALGWEQALRPWWTSDLDYSLQIEGAAQGAATNLLGLGEGTRYGLFQPDNSWHDEHILSTNRARYTQHATLKQMWKVAPSAELSASYDFEYRNQYKPTLLRSDLSSAGGIWQDPWFKARPGRDSLYFVNGSDSVAVDALRWAQYQRLGASGTLAYGLREQSYTQTPGVSASYKAGKALLKLSGRWTWLTDISIFTRDSLHALDSLGLADSTWSKLGYEFHGNEYFEHSYPLTISIVQKNLSNRIELSPRFKDYVRLDRSETEWRITDRMEIPLRQRRYLVRMLGDFRWMGAHWTERESQSRESESEWDVIGELSLRINHTEHFYTEYTVRGEDYRRPDYLENQYRDLYTGLSVYYGF